MYKYLNINDKEYANNIEKVGNAIREGKIVIFPTETVYAIGTNGLDYQAVKKLYDIKKRSYNHPINLLVSDIQMIENITMNITNLEYKLMEKFFPGPLTIILNKNEKIPNIVTSGSDKVGVRIPNDKIAQDLIKVAKVPMAAPSANISGKPSGTNIDDIKDEFEDIEYIIDGGETKLGIESTIVQVIEDEIHILRPGNITYDDLKVISDKVIKDYEDEKDKFKHYIPSCKCVLVYSKHNKKMVDKIRDIASKYNKPLILSYTENIKEYGKINTIDIGFKFNLEEISKNIFKSLREIDKFNPDIVIIEGIEKIGIGIAIMDRLEKACQGNYIEI